MACAFLQNCDSNECGSLKKNFQVKHALNDNQHPKKVMGGSDAFQSHVWDQVQHKMKSANKKKNQNKTKAMTKKESGMSLAQQLKNTMCHCCGEKGHCMSDCLMKDKMS